MRALFEAVPFDTKESRLSHDQDSLMLLSRFILLPLHRLSQMILDKTLHGILDQGAGCLVVFDEPEEDVSSIREILSFLLDFSSGDRETYSILHRSLSSETRKLTRLPWIHLNTYQMWWTVYTRK